MLGWIIGATFAIATGVLLAYWGILRWRICYEYPFDSVTLSCALWAMTLLVVGVAFVVAGVTAAVVVLVRKL